MVYINYYDNNIISKYERFNNDIFEINFFKYIAKLLH